ncbi:MAG TPA: hypothetical protein VNL18_11920 [Gemmatimonadales bacterium]|nr:hypothetical protein [Gemmatimonadales bacterium]
MNSREAPARWPEPRARKFRQAAFVYLHVGILYEGATFAMWRRGLLPEGRGAGWLWMIIGAGIVAAVVWGLARWQNVWVARIVWAIAALRVPTLIGHTFFPSPEQRLSPEFYGVALLVVMINLWMLARAGWDL